MTKIWIYFIICAAVLNAESGGRLQSTSPQDTSSSFWGGIYKVTPLLSESRYEKLTKKLKQIENDIIHLNRSKDSLEQIVPDSLQYRKYITFLGGLYTIPKTEQAERQLKKVKFEIYKLIQKQKNILLLFEKHRQYDQKQLLWGFASWEVKKTR